MAAHFNSSDEKTLFELVRDKNVDKQVFDEKLEQLVNKNPGILKARNQFGDTPLNWASSYGIVATVMSLIRAGSDPEERGYNGRNSVLAAAEQSNDAVLKYFYDKFPDLFQSTDDNGATPLTLASNFGDPSTMIDLIKDYHADVNARGIKGRNCVLSAASSEKSADKTQAKLRYLYKNHRGLFDSKDDNGDTVVTLVSKFGAPSTLKMCVEEFQLDVNVRGYQGRNCVLQAAIDGNYQNLKYLYSIKPDLFKSRCDFGDTPLTIACWGATPSTVKTLISECNVDINELGNKGQNCVLRAISGGNDSVIKYFYDDHRDVFDSMINAVDEDGDSALLLAAGTGKESTIKLLKDLGISSDNPAYLDKSFFMWLDHGLDDQVVVKYPVVSTSFEIFERPLNALTKIVDYGKHWYRGFVSFWGLKHP